MKLDHAAAKEAGKNIIDADIAWGKGITNLARCYLDSQAKLEEAMTLLGAAKCPQCDGSGSWADPSDGSQMQCQWCFEYQALREELEKE